MRGTRLAHIEFANEKSHIFLIVTAQLHTLGNVENRWWCLALQLPNIPHLNIQTLAPGNGHRWR